MVILIASAILFGLLANEAWAYLPSVQRAILRLATALMPPAERDRYFAEWQQYLLDFPGEMTRAFLAFGCLGAGVRYRSRVSLKHVKARLLRYVPIVDDRKWQVMFATDMLKIIAAAETGIVTDLECGEERLSEKRVLSWLKFTHDKLSMRELEEELGLSRARDRWQSSRPVKLLRRGYGLLIKSYLSGQER